VNLKFKITKQNLIRAGVPIVALGLIASVVAGRERPTQVSPQPVARVSARVDATAALDHDLDLSKLQRPVVEAKVEQENDPFARRSFAAPEPEQRHAAPATPPLPFQYLGKALEDGKLSVFLARGDQTYSVNAGAKRQKIDAEYRVDKVTESAVTFTHLPTSHRQVLEIPAVN